MNANDLQSYIKLLTILMQSNCKILHFIIYRHAKIANISFSQLLSMPTFLPSSFQIDKILIEDDHDKYINYKNNVHHWTTAYVWKNFIPKLMQQLQIDFNQKDFIKIPYIWDTCDFSYHKCIKGKFKISDFNGRNLTGNHDILRIVNDCPISIISLYHSLFRLNHQSGIIGNILNNDLPIQRMVVNCDSMAIPIIPILACYCKNMLVIDNRTNRNMAFIKKIIEFKPTHYISLFTEENFLFNAKHIKQIL